MKKRTRTACDLLLGLSFIISVILGYYKDISHMSEYCFLSGLLVGSLLLVSFFRGLRGKGLLPVWLYSDCMVSTLIIFIATVAIRLNLDGAFWFIHIINPLLMFFYWCVFCDHSEIRNNFVIATCLVLPACYFIFALVLYKTSGLCPFPANLILVDSTPAQTALGFGAILLLFAALGYSLHFLNRLARRAGFLQSGQK